MSDVSTGSPRTVPQLLATSFRVNDAQVSRAVADFSEADWAATHGAANRADWILGHLAWSRRATARAVGCDIPTAPWEAAYEMGADGTVAAGLTADDLMADFVATGLALCERLAEMDADALAAEAPFRTPAGKDLASVLGFLFFHESYHIGQLGLIRRLQGKDGLA